MRDPKSRRRENVCLPKSDLINRATPIIETKAASVGRVGACPSGRALSFDSRVNIAAEKERQPKIKHPAELQDPARPLIAALVTLFNRVIPLPTVKVKGALAPFVPGMGIILYGDVLRARLGNTRSLYRCTCGIPVVVESRKKIRVRTAVHEALILRYFCTL